MKDYPNLSVFLDKHRIAQQNNSKEVRFTMAELNDVVHDIHKLMASVAMTQQDQSELKELLKSVLFELKELSDQDGGTF